MKIKNPPKLASFILRISLALPFLYAAISSTLQPESWAGFLPSFIRNLLPVSLLLGAFSFYQACLTFWLFSGWRTKEAALFASATMVAITLANITLLDIVFRDIGLLLAALALYILQIKK